MSFILLLAFILVTEYFDNTLRNIDVAQSKLNIAALGMMPKIFRANNKIDFDRIQKRLLESIVINIYHFLKNNTTKKPFKSIVVFSIREHEGKTVLATNIAQKIKESGKSIQVFNHSKPEINYNSSSKYPFLHKLFGYGDPRIDYEELLLSNVHKFSEEQKIYDLDYSFFKANNYKDLKIQNETTKKETEYVVIELPNILETNYPVELFESADMAIMVCRANRTWTKADQNLLNNIKELTGPKLHFIINGTELNEVESILGELPKKRSKTRSKIKNMLQFQFNSKNQI